MGYPLVNLQITDGKSPFSMGKSTIMGYHVNEWFFHGLMGYSKCYNGF